MLLSAHNELDEWLSREETREESLQDISQNYILENQRKLEFWQGVFPILILLRIIFLIAAFVVVVKLAIRLCSKERIYKKPNLKNIAIYAEPEPEEPAIYQARHGEWSPTGWVYDRDTQKWDPPEYLAEESARKWRWNEEKRIWVDQDKEERLQRYREYRKSQGNGPTYEEWKAARLAEEKEKHSEV